MSKSVRTSSRTPELTAAARAERRYQRAQERAETLRRERNAAIRAALGRHSQSEVAQATGLTRGRIGQLSTARDDAT